MAIHRRRGGRYWYYWIVIIGGLAFAIVCYATDGFGLAP